jgi:ABC-type multidrug transport system fused ATPase/permease subunit
MSNAIHIWVMPCDDLTWKSRPVMVQLAEHTFVLHEGSILEEGKHGELLGLRGRYAELFELQASAYR